VFRRPAGATTTNDGSSDAAAAASREDAPQVGPKKLKPADEKLVNQLAQIDRKVRAHEAAHQAAAGSLGGAVSFTYETGPDGKSYAIGGEVPILISPGRTPDETIARAEQVRAAALAPADPSPQDLAVAAVASQMEAQARQQMAELQAAEPQPQARPQAGAAPRAEPQSQSRPLGPGREDEVLGRERALPVDAGSVRPVDAVATGSPSATLDVGERAASTIAALVSERASSTTSTARLQQLARLAATAYRM